MKMKDKRRKGFVLILVLLVLSVIGLEMFVLASGSNIMLFQANTAYLRACESNLMTSGLAWAEKNIKDGSKEIFDKTIELDITNMNIKSAALRVVISAPSNEEKEVQINTLCSRARQTRSSTNKFRIGL